MKIEPINFEEWLMRKRQLQWATAPHNSDEITWSEVINWDKSD
jgi:hypothetical protein